MSKQKNPFTQNSSNLQSQGFNSSKLSINYKTVDQDLETLEKLMTKEELTKIEAPKVRNRNKKYTSPEVA